MKKKRISDAISNINESIIEESALYQQPKTAKRSVLIKRTVAFAACLVLVLGSVIVFTKLFNNTTTVSIGGITREYRMNKTVYFESSAIVWPRKYLKIQNQYNFLKYNGIEYNLHSGNAVDKSRIGDSLGTVTAYGYDETDNGKMYTRDFEIFKIKDSKTDYFIAVLMEGEYYMFGQNEFNPPETLGKLINDFNLTENIELKYFETYTNYKGDINSNYFSTENGEKIWELLLKCGNTPYLDEDVDLWLRGEREFTSFTVTLEAFNIYNRFMYITSDGYIETNLFDYAYVYYIGKDAATEIIECAKKNAVKDEKERKPHNYSVVGTVTEIGKDYFLVDDSVLCKNENDGITFRIDATDLIVWRYIDSGHLKVGDIVSVDFFDEVDTENGNLIKDAYNISTSVSIQDDKSILIFE